MQPPMLTRALLYECPCGFCSLELYCQNVKKNAKMKPILRKCGRDFLIMKATLKNLKSSK